MNDSRVESGSIARLLGETRWKLLGELCRKPHTVAELAELAGISANAVRVHLEELQRAELVSYAVERRGVGKPAHVYSLTPSAESLLSKAYAPALAAILAAARAQLNGGFATLMRTAGATLGDRARAGDGGRNGIHAATALLEGFGAVVDVAQGDGATALRVGCCPLAAVTRDGDEICLMMQSALSEASGLAAREQCIRGEHPRCAFELAPHG